jgi:protein-L-isoaspartate(D-aspartate) O-methyltransferase
MAHATLQEARKAFTEELRVTAHVTDERVLDAFAAVPREHFAGPGPWRIRHAFDGYWTTSDAEPHWLYHCILVALDEARGINIGDPFLWSFHLDRIGVKEGDRVLQIGAGSGYYTAVLAELAGKPGRVDAIEIDAPLAAAAQANIAPWPNATVKLGDASARVEGQWDVVVAFAGATAPHGWWLDAIADGGKLLLPLTPKEQWGFMLRVDRHGKQLAARSAGRVGFYPCAGARNDEDERALAAALADAAGQQQMRRLRLDPHDKDETCWLHRDGWCLSKQALH